MNKSLIDSVCSSISTLSDAIVIISADQRIRAFSQGATNIVSTLKVGEEFSKIPRADLAHIAVLRIDELGSLTPQQDLSQQGKLESLGGIASGIAHDINNIVTGILGHVGYLKIILGPNGKHSESVKSIEDGAKRAAALSQQVLKFNKAEELSPSRIDARDVVKSTLSLLRAAIPPGCDLTSSLPDHDCPVLAVETQLSQIVLNLVVNARDAVGLNGQIEVVLSSVSDVEEINRAFQGADRSSNSYIRLIVADNGQGMSEDVKRRMFEPYFTTKKSLGTGLGLATVNQIVKQFGGAIVVDSTVGRGTTIAVYLPEFGKQEAVAEEIRKIQGGRGRILVIDDEYSVRNVLCLSLEHLGYEVMVASGGAEALALYKDRVTPIDLVLLDMIMPDMPGEKVFNALKKIDPDVAVMVVSGFAAPANIEAILDGGGLDYLPKPFTIEELASKVRGCLE